jgi:hypothetical protein
MKLEVLLGGLENPQPAVRLDVARALGMLDETRALDKLRERFAAEPDPAVRSAIGWAGKRLFQAQQAGYSTLNEVCREFGVDKEIEHTPDVAELEMMDKLERTLQQDLADIKQRGTRTRLGLAVAAGVVGGVGAGMGALMMGMGPGAGSASAMDGRPQIGTTRAPATAPADTDITIWVRRLREGSTPEVREQAAIQLAELNNPRALPHLAAAFVDDPSPKVQQAAQRFGKLLYWRSIYWDMEQSGALAEEMVRRAAATGKTIKPNTLGPDPTPISPPPGAAAPPQAKTATQETDVDVAEILRKAQEGRARRKSQGRGR